MATKSDFWGLEDDEQLIHTEMDEAIEDELDGWDKLTGTLVICGYVHEDKPLAESYGQNVLERLLEDLDDNYGNPEGTTSDTDAMKEAATVFVQAVLNEYTVWRCKQVESEIIDVEQWVKTNRPDWLVKNET